MNIGLFGGTFDPIHNGHIRLAELFRKRLQLDEVWFLVTPQNPWKTGKRLSDDRLRLEMARKALEGYDGLVASDYEYHLPKPSFSYQTLRNLRHDFPADSFTLLIGADNWVAFDKWAEHEEIMQHHRIAVFPRLNSDFNPHALPQGVCFLDAPLLNVSSTEVRERICRGEDVSGLIPDVVKKYIEENGLYT